MDQEPKTSSPVGVVVIGRNEGERLERCLESVLPIADCIVYVDSGSRDRSVAMSRSLGINVVELDLARPFTAARARNEGYRELLRLQPTLKYLFFVDGDCEVVHNWLATACAFLDAHPDVAVVWGRRRERHPERSIYNLLCDIEWDSIPVGETKACGGDAVMRAEAVCAVHGYRADLICGEEPELCVRLRKNGWRIWRLDHEMTLHDAAVYRFSQWWQRMIRGGYAYALGVHLHGAPPERHWVAESRSAWLWGCFIPATILLLALSVSPDALWLVALYPLQVVRLAAIGKRTARENWWRALSLVACKFPEMLGQFKFLADKWRHVQSRLIEYK